MDLFNKKKLAYLQAQFDELRDLVGMMDDELLQVAKSRYQNKYLEYTDSDGATRIIKISDISVAKGIVFLTGNDNAKLCHTLSHLRTISKVTTKKAYLEYHSTYKND